MSAHMNKCSQCETQTCGILTRSQEHISSLLTDIKSHRLNECMRKFSRATTSDVPGLQTPKCPRLQGREAAYGCQAVLRSQPQCPSKTGKRQTHAVHADPQEHDCLKTVRTH